jgi:hypothetical protein
MHSSRSTIPLSRALTSILTLTLFTSLSLSPSLLPVASAVAVTNGNCTIDGSGTANFQLLDQVSIDGTCTVQFNSGSSSITLPAEVASIRTLAVGGGGGGGFGGNGGGGGAGAVIYSTTGLAVTSGSVISVAIGVGGLSPISKSDPTNQAFWGQGARGETTTMTIAGSPFYALGGGGGGGLGTSDQRTSGTSGGSGGGSAVNGATSGTGATYLYNLWSEAANAGFKSTATSGGGGGGAGAAATNFNGAIGITVLGYKVGGGGGGWSTGNNTAAAEFGGGAPRGSGAFPCTSNTCHGLANTGGGGGGGGDGGSGLAVVKFVAPRGQGSIAATRTSIAGRTHSFTFTATNAPATGVTRTFKWQVQQSGSSSWIDVSGGTGATSASFTTKALSGIDSDNSYRVAVTDTNATLGIATTTYTSVAGATLANLTVDYALNLTGTNQYAQAADANAFDLTSSFTFQAWVYPTDVSVYKMVANKENSYMFYIANGFWTLSLDGPSTTWSVASNDVPAIANEWHHIAITKSGLSGSYSFYYDGVLAYTGAADTLGTSTAVNTTDPFTIGSRTAYNDHFFKGMIDNVAGFNVVRTQSQIQSDMNNYIAGDTSGLLYYYDFNEGSGATVYNHVASATSATDLTITGATFVDVKSVDNSSVHQKITFPRSYITPIGGWQSPNAQLSYSTLVVAGGGAGGARVSSGAGGGGGAGGMVESAIRTIDSKTVLGIRVGQGGLGTRTGTMATIATGDNGQNSVIQYGTTASPLYVTAIGGGGGAGGYGSVGDPSYNGSSGGSGGGASGSNVSGYLGGASTQTSAGLDIGYGNNGGGNPGCPSNRPGGGGGGAGGAGELSTVCTQSGGGGNGRISSITGLTYAGGGGAGRSGDSGGSTVTAGAGGSGGGAAGSAGSLIGSSSEYLGNAGLAGTGGGGGGVGISAGIIRGGAGGSGVIVIKIQSTSVPIYIPPTSDTTTAGLSHTFTALGTPPASMVRTYRWQSSNDTGTTWINISIGSGFTSASYTTPILETSTSGARYQYRVVVTDTETGTVISDTSTGVFLIINPRILITGSYTVARYGTSHTDTFTVDNSTGTGIKTIRRTSSEKTNIIWDTSTANIARVTVSANLAAGIYYDTLTVTDQKSAITEFGLTITVLKAETVTITVAHRNDTYTASSLSYIDSYSVTGLVASDTLSVTNFQYSGVANDGTIFALAGRPAIAGTYSIIPTVNFSSLANYESLTVNNGVLTINRKLRTIFASARPTTLKYGETSTLVSSVSEGAADGTIGYTSDTTSRCTFSGAVVKAIEANSNCQFTTSISRGSNYETATSSVYVATLTQADTLTVFVESITALTYTGYQAALTPTIRVHGLVHTDAANSNAATFSYRSSTSSGAFTSVKPTNSDTYTVRADTLTLTSGLLSRYRAITYIDGTLRINRAQQFDLVIPQYQAIFGAPYQAIAYGGSGTGAMSYSVSPGSALSCSISGDTVTTSSEGSCYLTATRSQDQNYETRTVSAYIYFLIWSAINSPAPAVGSGSTIALTAETTLIRDVNLAPSITSVGLSGDLSYPVAINGSGFLSSSAGATTIKFWRGKTVSSSGFIIKSDSLIWSTQPAGATTGRLAVENSNGIAVSAAPFEPITP